MRRLFYALAFVSGMALATTAPISNQPLDPKLEALRAQARANGWTFQLGETPISHLPEEAYTGFHREANWKDLAPFVIPPHQHSLPATWDWRDKGALNPIRDQASPQYCGSCWAHGTVAALEAAIFIKTGKLPQISEQQLVSCQPSYGTCEGGDFAFGFYKVDGANYRTDFPYVAADVPCNEDAAQHEKISNWGYVGAAYRQPTTEELKDAIYTYGPVAATISASGAWQYYKGGVYNECNQGMINHIIAIVGWDDTTQSWIIRNSHGTGWGEAGYMHIKYTDQWGRKCNRVGDSAAFVQP